ncbi:hypothetical protein Taro_038902 [Colocasia esculenta]|uniref:Secreted protein n=1 Tax=Colocasia esculenta TaxID=4460 RepID=A0A843WU20_COLES|nr:hypothetical protein [Colocasia esculenta]
MLRRIFWRFRLLVACAAWDPREDGVRSVGMMATRSFWRSLVSSNRGGAAVGPFVRDCETERWFLCCVVRVGYWRHEPVVCSRVVA